MGSKMRRAVVGIRLVWLGAGLMTCMCFRPCAGGARCVRVLGSCDVPAFVHSGARAGNGVAGGSVNGPLLDGVVVEAIR